MKWYEYPLVFAVGFVLLILGITLIGFIFFKFFVILFIIGLIVIILCGISYIFEIAKKSKNDKWEWIDEIEKDLPKARTTNSE